MNYSRHREAAKRKLQSKKHELSVMSGEDRTKLENHLINQAHSEVEAELKAENELLRKEIEAKENIIAEKSDAISLKEKENEELLLANMDLEENLKKIEIVKSFNDEVESIEEAAEEVKLSEPPKEVLPHKKHNKNGRR